MVHVSDLGSFACYLEAGLRGKPDALEALQGVPSVRGVVPRELAQTLIVEAGAAMKLDMSSLGGAQDSRKRCCRTSRSGYPKMEAAPGRTSRESGAHQECLCLVDHILDASSLSGLLAGQSAKPSS